MNNIGIARELRDHAGYARIDGAYKLRDCLLAAADIVEKSEDAQEAIRVYSLVVKERDELRAKVDGLEAELREKQAQRGVEHNRTVDAERKNARLVAQVSSLTAIVAELREVLTTIMMNAQKYSGWWSYETARAALAKEGN